MYKLKKLFPLRLHLKLVWDSVFPYPERKQQWSTPKEAGVWKCIFKIHNQQQKFFYFLFSLSLFFYFILSTIFFTRGILLWKKKKTTHFLGILLCFFVLIVLGSISVGLSFTFLKKIWDEEKYTEGHENFCVAKTNVNSWGKICLVNTSCSTVVFHYFYTTRQN